MSLAGSSQVGEQRQTPYPALRDRGAQKAFLLLACLWVIPRSEGLSCRGKGSAGRMGAETSVLNMAGVDRWTVMHWKCTPGAGFPCPVVPLP